MGFGGNQDGSKYFNVITADEKVCVDHMIPQISATRYSPVITTIDNWSMSIRLLSSNDFCTFRLFVCSGYTTACNKLDLDQEYPTWSGFVNVPYNLQ